MRGIVASVRALALACALMTGLMSTAQAQQIPLPANDPFYTPPAGYETLSNGTVLNNRQIAAELLLPPLDTQFSTLLGNLASVLLPQLKLLQNLKIDAYQVLYKSTDAKGQPTVEVATILVPHGPWSGAGTRPLVSYESAEDSTSTSCEPSYILRTGVLGEGALSVSTYDVALVLPALGLGYAVVIADYEGPNSGYTVGMQAAHGVLDGIRAALNYAPAGLSSSTKVGIWGYSGGGQAAAWAAEQKQLYAPELNVVGAVEGAVPSDLHAVIKRNNGSGTAGFIPLALAAQARAFPEAGLGALLNAKGQQTMAVAGSECTVPGLIDFVFLNIDGLFTVPDPIDSAPAEYLYGKSNLGQAVPSMPVFQYQDQFDEIMPVAMNNQQAQNYCDAGVQVLTLRTLTSLPAFATVHTLGDIAGTPLALGYLTAVFSDTTPQLPGMLVPTLNNCPSHIPSLINSLPWWNLTRVALAVQPWPWQSY